MQAGRYDFSIKQGSTFEKAFTFKHDDGTPHDLTGFDIKMQIREDYNSSPLLELTTINGKITYIDESEGHFKIRLSPNDTKNLTFCQAVYDLDIYDIDNKYTILEGVVKLIREVTRNV